MGIEKVQVSSKMDADNALFLAEVALQTEAARETQAILLALVPKQTANEWLRNQGVQMFPKENENGPC